MPTAFRWPGGPSAMRHTWGSLLVLSMMLGLCLPLGCGPERVSGVPPELLGRWETDAARYEDRWFEIRPAELVWGMGRFEVYAHPIQAIEREPAEDGHQTYRFHYTEEAGYDEVQEVHLHEGPPVSIRLGTREMPWHRVRTP